MRRRTWVSWTSRSHWHRPGCASFPIEGLAGNAVPAAWCASVAAAAASLLATRALVSRRLRVWLTPWLLSLIYAVALGVTVRVLPGGLTRVALPEGELAAGFVEALKTGLLAGGELWERVRTLESLDPADLDDVVFACARYKCEVVAADERDAGLRQVLNLGHTVGHAIEAASGYERYRHGEAIGLGLLAALRLSDAPELRTEVETILERHGLPVVLDPAVGVEETLAALQRDKKRTAAGVGFVLLAEPGAPRTGQLVDPAKVEAAVKELYQ